jgi:glutathione peroxidase
MNYKSTLDCIRRLWIVLPVIALLTAAASGEGQKVSQNEEMQKTGIYDFTVADIDGNDVNLADYKGRVLLIVNTASKCGFTPQYEGLEKIYTEYKDRGFEILAFPSNDFMGQEPGTNEQIKNFCQLNYHVSFPLFSKITVKGEKIHPLYRYLTEKSTDPEFAGKITWNFNKFLIDGKGKIVNRFDSKVKPQSPELVKAVEKALQENQ